MKKGAGVSGEAERYREGDNLYLISDIEVNDIANVI